MEGTVVTFLGKLTEEQEALLQKLIESAEKTLGEDNVGKIGFPRPRKQ